MFRKLVATAPVWMPVPIRLALAVIFVAHGAQKVLGSFNGPGLAQFTSFPAPFPFMRPAWLWMGAAAVSELIGGILVFVEADTQDEDEISDILSGAGAVDMDIRRRSWQNAGWTRFDEAERSDEETYRR